MPRSPVAIVILFLSNEPLPIALEQDFMFQKSELTLTIIFLTVPNYNKLTWNFRGAIPRTLQPREHSHGNHRLAAPKIHQIAHSTVLTFFTRPVQNVLYTKIRFLRLHCLAFRRHRKFEKPLFGEDGLPLFYIAPLLFGSLSSLCN